MFTTQIKSKSDGKRVLNITINGVIASNEYWIGDTGLDRISNEIKDFKATKDDEIHASINSPGGDYFAGVAIYNTLKNSTAKVITQNMGLAASAASVIFMAGDERIVYPGTSTMTHDPLTGAYGNADDLRNIADELDNICESAKGVYLTAGIDSTKLVELMKNETMMTPEQAIEFGFATDFNKTLSVSNCIFSEKDKQLAIDNSFGARVKKAPVETNENQADSAPQALDAGEIISLCAKNGLNDFIADFHAKGFTKQQVSDNIANINEIKNICAASNIDFNAVKDKVFNQADLIRAIIVESQANDETIIIEQSDQTPDKSTKFEIKPENGVNNQ